MPFFKPPRGSRFAATRAQRADHQSRVVPPAQSNTPSRHHRVLCDGSLTTNYNPEFVSEDGLRAYCHACRKRVGLNSATQPPHLYSHTIRVSL